MDQKTVDYSVMINNQPLPCTRHCLKGLACVNSENLHSKLVILVFLFYGRRDRGKERLSDLLKATELVRGRAKI